MGKIPALESATRTVVTGLVIRTLVADGTILIGASGTIGAAEVTRLEDEVTRACEVCRGLVLLDLSGCSLSGDDAVRMVRAAAVRARRTRCRLRVVTDDRSVVAALDKAGIAHNRMRTSGGN